MWTEPADHVGMVRKSFADQRSIRSRERRAAKRIAKGLATPPAERAEPQEPPELFLGEWLDRLGLQQKEVAQAAGITPAYLNNLVNPAKLKQRKNPRIAVMLRISAAIGVSINDLYKRPPTRAEADRLRQFQPSTIDALRAAGALS